ncbi:MAG TPA: AAA family ATPase [Candidatus Thalassarchaeaceae archaeon]|nr:AAA family ATPase [Candidatus Thalassarchaeaceae archaeon]
MVPRLLVITGTSGVGKTTLTGELAAALGFGKIASTDTIREVLRSQFDSEDAPALHRSSFEPAGGDAVTDWRETVGVVSQGVEAVIQRAQRKEVDLIIEGVHYVPGSGAIEGWRSNGFVACGVVLHVSDEDLHKQMIASRENHNDKLADHYLSNFSRIRKIQSEMLVNAKNAGWIAMDITDDVPTTDLIAESLENDL